MAILLVTCFLATNKLKSPNADEQKSKALLL